MNSIHFTRAIGSLILAVALTTAAAAQVPYFAPAPAAPAPVEAEPPPPAAAVPVPAAPVPVAAAPPAAPLYPPGTADFHVNGASVIPAAPPPSPEQQKADTDAQAAWQARCQPTVVEDREGIRRTHYAAPDCDLSQFNTAGAK